MKNQTRKLVRRQSRNGTRTPEIASKNCNTWLYAEDLEEVLRMVSAKGSNESAVIREIVHEWMRLKKKKALATEAATGPEQIRNLLSEVVEQQLKSVREKQAAMGGGIGELLGMLAGVKDNFQGEKPDGLGAAQAVLPPEFMALLTRLEEELTAARRDISATRPEVGEGVGTQIHQLGRLIEGSHAQYTLLAQTFICNWTTLDFVVRFLVEASLRAQQMEVDQIDAETTEDRVNLRTSGLQIIQSLERQLKLPADLTLKLLNPLLPAPEGA